MISGVDAAVQVVINPKEVMNAYQGVSASAPGVFVLGILMVPENRRQANFRHMRAQVSRQTRSVGWLRIAPSGRNYAVLVQTLVSFAISSVMQGNVKESQLGGDTDYGVKDKASGGTQSFAGYSIMNCINFGLSCFTCPISISMIPIHFLSGLIIHCCRTSTEHKCDDDGTSVYKPDHMIRLRWVLILLRVLQLARDGLRWWT